MYTIAKENKDYIVTETPGIGNKLISRDLIGDLRFPEKTKLEDLVIMPVIIASSEKLFHIDEPVYNYRVNMNTTIKDFINKIPNILDVIKCVENIEIRMQENRIVELYKSKNVLFNFDMNRLNKYTNEEYRNVDRKTVENNIKRAFR